MSGSQDHWQRFFEGDEIRLIQCAEQLEGPEEILEKTYSSSTWQNQTLMPPLMWPKQWPEQRLKSWRAI